MTTKIAIVTGGDSKYYALMCELLASIRRFPESRLVDIHILDAGLDASQVKCLQEHNFGVFKPDWPTAHVARKGQGKEYLKACILRPFLRDLLPGYDIYIWLDADTWVQQWDAVDLYIRGASTGALTCTVGGHPARPKTMRIKWLGPFPFKPRSFYYSNARRAFGGRTARALFPYNAYLAGAFSLHRDAPHWPHWQALILKAMKKGKLFTAEQLTLGIMLHLDKLPVQVLPYYCNWVCGWGLRWNPASRQFTEPFLPYQPLGLIHLCGVTDARADASATVDVEGLDGVTRKMPLRFGPQFDETAAELLSQLTITPDRNIGVS